jgi:mRNA interferase RelE/StbE
LGWTISLSNIVVGELGRLPKIERERILTFLFDRVTVLDNPKRLGKPLSEAFVGYWRYRIGDYRIICNIDDRALIVLVVRVGQRNEVYRRPLG